MRWIAAAIATSVFAIPVGGTATAAHRRPLPRGTIVFNRFSNSKHDSGALFTVKTNGSGVRQLTHPPASDLDEEPVWSPSGKLVAFQRTESGKTAVYLVAADGRGERPLLPTGAALGTDSPAWSPDGSKLAVGLRQGNREIVAIVTKRGRVLARVTQRGNTASTFVDSQPAWSPDGKRLTFVRQTEVPSRNGLQALFIVNANGAHERRISPWALRAGHHPNWSPSGTHILFTSNADRADPNVRSNLYSIRPNGDGLRQLTHARPGQVYLSATFSPDGRWIIFALEPSPNANAQLFVMHANGTGRRAITNPSAWSSAPDWTSRQAQTG